MESQIITEFSPHRCRHCKKAAIVVDDSVRSRYSPWTQKWHHVLDHTMADVHTAMDDECPFFVWLWRQIEASQTPYEQLQRTKIRLELGTMAPTGDFIAQNTHCVSIVLSTGSYSWVAGRFRTLSSVDDPSADNAIGRQIMGDVSAPRSLRQIQNRLAYCSRHHPGCNIRDETSDIRPSRFLSINLAPSSASGESEADKIKLIEATLANNEPYIILSYVWGHIQTIQTTAETIGQHKSGILTATLPQTIRDAITVTRKLGVGLLWVDSLCIVQDDAEELAREVAKMSSYYRNALLTISAAIAPSCETGFLRRDTQHEAKYQDLKSGFDLPFHNGGRSAFDGDDLQGYITLVPHESTPRHAVDLRAWTLQEGLLSTRLVSFGADTISWSCLSVEFGKVTTGRLRKAIQECKAAIRTATSIMAYIMPEEEDLSSALPDKEPERRYKDSYSEFKPGSLAKRARSWGSGYSSLRVQQGEEAERHFLGTWDEIICEYTSRALSDPADRVIAVSAIAREFSPLLGSPLFAKLPKYLAGLWWSDRVGFQLLWRPTKQCLQRRTAATYVAPSWSWASVDVPLHRPGSRDEYVKWIKDNETTEFQIISSELELQSTQAPFGAVKSGYMLVKGRTISISEIKQNKVRVKTPPQMSITLDEDLDPMVRKDLGNIPLEDTTVLLQVIDRYSPVLDKSGNVKPGEGFPAGLVLSMNEDGTYRRLGLFYGDIFDAYSAVHKYRLTIV